MEQQERCDHCLRTDLGSKAAGRATVTVRGRTYQVCSPTVKYRPRCDTLMANFSEGDSPHTAACALCWVNNPPGLELRYQKDDADLDLALSDVA